MNNKQFASRQRHRLLNQTALFAMYTDQHLCHQLIGTLTHHLRPPCFIKIDGDMRDYRLPMYKMVNGDATSQGAAWETAHGSISPGLNGAIAAAKPRNR